MASNEVLNLTELVPDFPNKPLKEIPRDSFIRLIADEFNANCRKILIASDPLSGKTNALAQFASYYQDRAISYFISSNPLTQDLKNYLYILGNQIRHILGQPSLPDNIQLETLKSSFSTLVYQLNEQARLKKIVYYFVVDGLEWGILGERGKRIIDFPLISFSGGPFVLYSCRLDRLVELPVPGDVCVKKEVSHLLQFNLNDTREYLSEFNLEEEEINTINQKAKGLPGYVKVIRDTLAASGTGWLKGRGLPDDLEKLIDQQLTLFYSSSSRKETQALEYIAISPRPFPIASIAEWVGDQAKRLAENLRASGLVHIAREGDYAQITSEYTKQVLLERIGPRKKELIEKVIEYLQRAQTPDELSITLLMKEVGDYSGIASLLDSEKIITTLSKRQDIGIVTKQFRIITDMAYRKKDLSGLVQNSLGLVVTKSFLAHTLNLKEILALISIGESEAALQRAYALPESISKIRLLARTYTTMQERDERIPIKATEELKHLVLTQNTEEVDKEIIQGLAIDIFRGCTILCVNGRL